LYAFMLWLPIWVIYLQEDHGLSLTQVTIIDFAFWLTMAFSEVPTGAVADTVGRKQSILIGLALSFIAVIFFALAPNFTVLLISNSVWAIAITFISGADMAFIYDTLKAINREGEYRKLRGKLATVTIAAIAISSALGGIIAERSLVLPFLIYLAFLGSSILITFTYKEPPKETHPDTGKHLSYKETLNITLKTIKHIPNLRFSLLYATLMPLGVFIVSIIFIQPYVVEIGLPYASLGFIVFGLRAVEMIASANADRMVKKTGEWNWIKFAPTLIVIGLVAIGVVPTIAGIFIYAIAAFSSAASRPLLEDLIQRQTPSSVRATILSVQSLLQTFFLAIFEPLLGFIADQRGLRFSFLVMAIGTVVIILPLLAVWRPHWLATLTVKNNLDS
ncbi:MAG: MFS transporter, partial [Chloroflexota bacterium]